MPSADISTDPSSRPGDRAVAWAILQLVRSTRASLSNEKATQADLEAAFVAHGWTFKREHRLSDKDIPDFFFPGSGLVVEVKLKGAGKMKVFRQLERYAAYDAVQAILLASNLSMGLVAQIGGKPAWFVSLGHAWM